MIDLHTHVIPRIDDGPADMDGSLALARAAAADGCSTIAATPHLRSDYPLVRPSEIGLRCELLNRHLADAGVPLEVVSGGEVDLYWAQTASDEELRLVALGQGGTFLLVETPYGELPQAFEDMLFQLQVRGFRPILAHPERSRSFRRAPQRLATAVSRGVFVQITLPSLVKRDRRASDRKFAMDAVKDGIVHLIGSDAHAASGSRPPRLSEARDAAAGVDPAWASWAVTESPAAILAGEDPGDPPRGPRTGSRRWRHRS